MSSPTIGDKRDRVTIQRSVQTPDGHGGNVTTWAPRCVVWANDRPLTGTEALRAQQVTAVLSSVWEIWFRSDISVKDRILAGSRVVNIESYYDPDGLKRELYLLCSEVQS